MLYDITNTLTNKHKTIDLSPEALEDWIDEIKSGELIVTPTPKDPIQRAQHILNMYGTKTTCKDLWSKAIDEKAIIENTAEHNKAFDLTEILQISKEMHNEIN